MAVDHRLLDRVQAAVRTLQILDGEQLAAVEGAHELDAGIDRAVVEPIGVGLGHDHGAGAAVALVAPFLGAGAAPAQPEPVEHRLGRVDPVELDQLVAEEEADLVTHGGASYAFARPAPASRFGAVGGGGCRRARLGCCWRSR